MTSALFAALASLVVCLAVTPIVRELALRGGIVDEPGGRRVHKEITPRLGGVGIYFGFFAPLLALTVFPTRAMQVFDADRGRLYGLFFGGTLVALVGAIDDIKGIGPWRKLLAQTLAACIAFAFGYRIQGVSLPWLGAIDLGSLSFLITIAWFLAVTNAINLIDGLDGLAGGIAFFACISNIFIAQIHGAIVVVLFSACLGGALLGFLRYNFNPASIFMGDSGSMFIGFVLAATSLAGATIKSSTAVAIVAPLVALGVPIFDTMLAMIRRTLAGQSIFAADRGHIHHRLLDFGFTHRRAVLTLHAMSVLLGLLAIGIAFERSTQVGASIVVAGLAIFVLVRLVRPSAARAALRGRTSDTKSLLRPVRDAAVALAKLEDLTSIRRVLGQLAGQGGIARAVLTVKDESSFAEPDDSGTLRYELAIGAQSYALDFTLRDGVQAADPQVDALLKLLSDAVSEALSRVGSRVEPRSSKPVGLEN